MQGALSRLGLALQASGGVLLCGEPGSGRESLARAIHAGLQFGAQARPFIAVDCTAGENLEQRLFGCGAFDDGVGPNGLDRIREGSKLHQAAGGILYFRHITQMPGALQDRLSRVLRDREVWLESAGAPTRWTLEIRPIATSSGVDMDGSVHPELRRRFSQSVVVVPPLRERREDIPPLVRWILRDFGRASGVPGKRVSAQAMALLAALPWRGNLRELRALLRVLTLRVAGPLIRIADVLAHVHLEGGANAFTYGGSLKEARERFEREYVAFVLDQHRGRMAEAAKTLGIQRTNLYRKVRQLSVHRPRSGDRPAEP